MLGTIVNCITVIIGSLLGVLCKKGISERFNTVIMQGLALCVLYIGISGVLGGQNVLVAIISMAIGAVLGEALNLDARLESLGKRLEKTACGKSGDGSIAKGFVAASLLFCVGAMSIVGSIQGGLTGDHRTIFAKSLIDGIAAIVLASTMGFGVIFSALFILVYQGGIALCAGFIQPLLNDWIIAEMSCVGSLLIVGLAFNMLGITKLKVMNFVPAVFMPIPVCWIIQIFS